jgi:GNAT superfamily N-acetyltransferase
MYQISRHAGGRLPGAALDSAVAISDIPGLQHMSSDPIWSLRLEASTDAGLLLCIYAAMRQNEEPMRRWPKAHRERFLALQLRAREDDYRRRYPTAERWIIRIDGKDAGRLLLDKTPVEHRVVDIALLPAFRRWGLGTLILRSVLADADADGANVALCVLADSPAQRLYERLGFRRCGVVVPPYLEMKRSAPPRP